ncbi:hypothetical protein PC128_g25280 [Phytophthora cactorum]|nr:hypothetical protein PC120_g17555 [Phytophthora cactorum]KAG3049929.1 hypothetical protein PC121_g18668 [Phytophthora cactorum]KAG3139957.1 hypothetical protein PC128_g25280 [Phytophthora cactorum]KAG4046283.1 hypothetical protein PC123_g18330 [Phytophthora cactorum]
MEEVIVKSEDVVAIPAVVPETVFEGHDSPFNANEVDRAIASATMRQQALTKSREEELEADFSGSVLERERRSLFTAML